MVAVASFAQYEIEHASTQNCTGSERHKLSAKMNGSLHTCTCSHVGKQIPLHSLTLLCPVVSWIGVEGRGWGRVISPYTRSTGMPYGPNPLKE